MRMTAAAVIAILIWVLAIAPRSVPAQAIVSVGAIQGAGHISPYNGQVVTTEGIVTVRRSSSFWMQDPTPDDSDPATSEGLLVFGSAAAALVAVGDFVRVRGTVVEFRPGGAGGFANLTTTELTSPSLSVTKLSSGNALPAPVVIGAGGRVPPTTVIEDDAAGSVETSGVFDPANDGIDFYESLEGMRVQLNNAVSVGPTNPFGEIPVVGDNGAAAGVRTARGGVVIRPNDFNPERILLDDLLTPVPILNVGDGFTTPVVGVLDYSFGNFKLAITSALTRINGGLAREATRAPTDHEIAVGTYNVENLAPGDGEAAFRRHADIIVNNLRSPDVLAIEEIQDNDGEANTSITDASVTWNMMIAAIRSVGGPIYQYRQIDPVDDQDGGVPGGNIRVGFLFRTDRGVEFIDRPGGNSTTPTTVVSTPSGPRLLFSPGRVDPQDPAWSTPEGVRKPLAGEFRARGKKLFVIANHWKSKTGDQPLFGRFQPPARGTETQRKAEAEVVKDFVNEILALDPHANVIVLGDLNDFEFSETLTILEERGDFDLHTLIETLSQNERYSYVFEGNSQTLDHIVISDNLFEHFSFEYDIVHVNSEFADQASDHEPQLVRLDLRGRPTPKP
jgi:predicted extracellular nuclease